MRVCLVTAHLGNAFHASNPINVRGAEVQYLLLAHALAERFDVHIVTSPPDNDGPVELPAGFRVHFVDPAWRNVKGRLPRARLYAKAFRQALAQADADVYMQTILSLDTLLTQRFCRRAQRAFVYHWASDADVDRLTKPGRRLTAWAYSRARKSASHQVCQTRTQHALLTGREQARASVVPNLLDTRLQWTPDAGRHDQVLWLGAIGPGFKRPDLFLDLAEALPHRAFRMVGVLQGPDAFVQGVKTRAERLANLEFVGFVASRKDLPAQYAAARCHVSLSDYEGFANTFLEAFASGVPVVSLNADPNDLLEGAGAGRCARGNFASMVRLVDAMFDDDAWQRHRKAALAVADAHRPGPIGEKFAAALGKAVAAAGVEVRRGR